MPISTSDFTKGLMLPAITDKETLDQLQEQLEKKITANWQTLVNSKANPTVASLTDNLVYRVLVNKNGTVTSAEGVDELSQTLLKTTPLANLLSQQATNLPNQEVQPVAELKVVFSPNGVVEVKWGEIFVP
ncbi:MAG: hypothetical protein U7127_18680 [Phormidium sp.]